MLSAPEPISEHVFERTCSLHRRVFPNILKMIKTKPEWKLIKHVTNAKKLEKFMFKKDVAFKQRKKAKISLINTRINGLIICSLNIPTK